MKLYVVIFISGLVIGAMGYALIAERSAPSTKPYANTKTVTTEISKTEGVPDTTINEKRETRKVKIKSKGSTEFKVDKNEVGIKEITMQQSNNDSNEVEVEVQYPEKTITRVDTVYKNTVIKDSSSSVKEIEKENVWQIAVGSVQLFNNQVEVNKYFEISYQKKIWFFYLKGFAGINNKLNDALSNLKIHTKVELNIPLN